MALPSWLIPIVLGTGAVGTYLYLSRDQTRTAPKPTQDLPIGTPGNIPANIPGNITERIQARANAGEVITPEVYNQELARGGNGGAIAILDMVRARNAVSGNPYAMVRGYSPFSG